MKTYRLIGVLGLGLFLTAPAAADPALDEGYGEDTISFERWCGEIKQWSAERCARRDESDLQAFKDAKVKLGDFEVDHVQERRREREFRRTLDAHESVDPNRRFDF